MNISIRSLVRPPTVGGPLAERTNSFQFANINQTDADKGYRMGGKDESSELFINFYSVCHLHSAEIIKPLDEWILASDSYSNSSARTFKDLLLPQGNGGRGIAAERRTDEGVDV